MIEAPRLNQETLIEDLNRWIAKTAEEINARYVPVDQLDRILEQQKKDIIAEIERRG